MSKNNHNSKAGSNIERSNERITATSEVFTPVELICLLLDQIPEEVLMNPESKFLDNAAGCGNFFLALKDILLQYHSEEHIINNMFYAVEFMEDNHKELCQKLGVSMDHLHYVHADALQYHYEFNGTPAQMTLDQFF
jgi:type I restriction-modification system DNA methylase subunit